jgi:nucleoside-diphosphate-sugar epimerase
MKALILGGTRYFGKRLALHLGSRGDDVTVCNRGELPPELQGKVRHQRGNRDDDAFLRRLAEIGPWDVVYDQVCYSPNQARAAQHAFAGHVRKLVHTSSQSVYGPGVGEQPESAFDPGKHAIRYGSREDFTYDEAKRLCEAVHFQTGTIPTIAVRFPIVLGPDDYTGRMEFHIDRVRQGKPIVVANLTAENSFISSEEAARFLAWCSTTNDAGPINACSRGSISIGQILRYVEDAVGKTAIIAASGADEDTTPIVDVESLHLDASKAEGLGFRFRAVRDWMPALIREIAGRTGR